MDTFPLISYEAGYRGGFLIDDTAELFAKCVYRDGRPQGGAVILGLVIIMLLEMLLEDATEVTRSCREPRMLLQPYKQSLPRCEEGRRPTCLGITGDDDSGRN